MCRVQFLYDIVSPDRWGLQSESRNKWSGRKSAAKKSPAKMDEKLNYILSIIYSPLQGKSVLRIKLALMWKMLRVLGRHLLKLMCWISDLVSELIPMTLCAYLKTVENVRNSLAWLPQTSLLKMAKPMKPTPEPLSVLLPWIETPFVSTFFFSLLVPCDMSMTWSHARNWFSCLYNSLPDCCDFIVEHGPSFSGFLH